MMVHDETSRDWACPFIEHNDVRCGGRFTLARLNEAFGVCVNGGYLSCPVYRQIVRERQNSDEHHLTIDITIEGHRQRRIGRARRLAV